MNVYKTIWLNPRLTFTSLITNDEKQPVYLVPVILIGLSRGVDVVYETSWLNMPSDWWISVIIGLGVIGTAILIVGVISGMIKLVGKIWKGPSTYRQMVNVYSLSLFPTTLILIYQSVMVIFGLDPVSEGLNFGLIYILWVWSFGLLIYGVAIIQNFRFGMALLNILLSYLPFFLIGLMIRS